MNKLEKKSARITEYYVANRLSLIFLAHSQELLVFYSVTSVQIDFIDFRMPGTTWNEAKLRMFTSNIVCECVHITQNKLHMDVERLMSTESIFKPLSLNEKLNTSKYS